MNKKKQEAKGERKKETQRTSDFRLQTSDFGLRTSDFIIKTPAKHKKTAINIGF
jgi:hypothetical protein